MIGLSSCWLPIIYRNPDGVPRVLPFSKVLYIERDDFAEAPPPKFKRLIPGGEIRLRKAYVIRRDELVCDRNGEIV